MQRRPEKGYTQKSTCSTFASFSIAHSFLIQVIPFPPSLPPISFLHHCQSLRHIVLVIVTLLLRCVRFHSINLPFFCRKKPTSPYIKSACRHINHYQHQPSFISTSPSLPLWPSRPLYPGDQGDPSASGKPDTASRLLELFLRLQITTADCS